MDYLYTKKKFDISFIGHLKKNPTDIWVHILDVGVD